MLQNILCYPHKSERSLLYSKVITESEDTAFAFYIFLVNVSNIIF